MSDNTNSNLVNKLSQMMHSPEIMFFSLENILEDHEKTISAEKQDVLQKLNDQGIQLGLTTSHPFTIVKSKLLKNPYLYRLFSLAICSDCAETIHLKTGIQHITPIVINSESSSPESLIMKELKVKRTYRSKAGEIYKLLLSDKTDQSKVLQLCHLLKLKIVKEEDTLGLTSENCNITSAISSVLDELEMQENKSLIISDMTLCTQILERIDLSTTLNTSNLQTLMA
jgi:hypothetical protein